MITEYGWAWKMDWCKRMGLNPSIPHNWQRAEEAWQQYQESNRVIEEHLRRQVSKRGKELLGELLSKE